MKGKLPNTEFRSFIFGLIFFTMLSSVPAYVFHDQDFDLSLIASRTIFFWLFYFVLHKLDIDPKDLKNILLFIGAFWALIMIYQQFTTNVIFNLHATEVDDTGEVIFRVERGVKRIYMPGTEFGFFTLFYAWEKIFNKITIKYLLLFSLAFVGLILTDSRQIIFGMITILGGSFLFRINVQNKQRIRFIFFTFLIAILVYSYGGAYISNLIKISQEQKSSDNFIREKAAEFYLFNYNPSVFCYIIGNGWENFYSSYGREVKESIEGVYGYFRSDIGLIGALNKFGALYVGLILVLYYRMIFRRSKLIIPIYVREFFLICLVTSFTGANYFEYSFIFPIFLCIFYIIDRKNQKCLLRKPNGKNDIMVIKKSILS